MNREIDDQLEIILLRKIIKGSNTQVFALDLDWNYIFFNHAHLELVKRMTGKAIVEGDHYPDLVSSHTNNHPEVTGMLQQVLELGRCKYLLSLNESGTTTYYEVSYELISDADRLPVVIVASLTDKTTTIRQNQELADKTQFLQGLLENLPVVLYKLKDDGTITLADGAGLSGLGIEGGDLVGKNAFELFPNLTMRLVQAFSANGSRFVAPARMNGNVVFFDNIIFTELAGANGEALGFAVDVTPYKLSEKEVLKHQVEIQQQTEHLKSLNAFKDKILAIISHDLRAPIASLMTLLPVIDELNPQDIRSLKMDAMEQLEEVSGLLDNLLHWAMNSFSKNLRRQSVAVDLSKLAEGNIHLFGKQAGAKRISLINQVIPGLAAFADWDQINIVIRNLLANAIKFTPEGGSIELSSFSFDGYVAFSVKDSGIGMSSQQLDQLFSHQSLSTCGTGGEKGTGLGLLLSKEYVEACGGQISAISTPGKGSTFTILLPLFEG
ncbi:hypothetical protein PBAL39_05903 [Pedobacter sp. BAL39]|uniref:sensor histidine kinase n=1 Tax=Pedobacter sp. BAL39 TaxID=391596 RepID=UPI000155A5C5|nr:PAS domain-containing sensor histidine kinase [Pedobacter sp. BAL39]EDM33991.1 hypothetical protein PBAL39_05903 [Pedobacter sp. BAL39]